MNEISVGIVGLGAISRRVHIPILSTFEDVKIKAAAEIDVRRGKRIAKKWNIATVFEDYNDMYEKSDLDAVFVCLPVSLHQKATGDALEHDLHVFCEKPFGVSSDNAYALAKKAEKKNLVLMVGYNRKFEGSYERAASIVKSMRLGKITQINGVLVLQGPYAAWFPDNDWIMKEESGGVLYDVGCHLFDLIIHISSNRISEVFAKSSKVLDLEVPHNIAGFFRTEEDVLGTFNIGWQTAVDYDYLQIHGTGGSLLASPYQLEEIHRSHGMLGQIMSHLRSAKRITCMGFRTSTEKPHQTYFKEDREFIDSIKGKKLTDTLREAVHVLEVLESINESIRTGKVVSIRQHFEDV